ncbi:uncharacterized protein LOC120313057 [Crotalus tigris]|uniref:uncharacterized protein LOC120313057 n=1 Tax=Crotalus tigris TaxID=88082 RepID=UPI00192F7764|nr:uncharacterized protein LOC120313057 [Crotalus tigris]
MYKAKDIGGRLSGRPWTFSSLNLFRINVFFQLHGHGPSILSLRLRKRGGREAARATGPFASSLPTAGDFQLQTEAAEAFGLVFPGRLLKRSGGKSGVSLRFPSAVFQKPRGRTPFPADGSKTERKRVEGRAGRPAAAAEERLEVSRSPAPLLARSPGLPELKQQTDIVTVICNFLSSNRTEGESASMGYSNALKTPPLLRANKKGRGFHCSGAPAILQILIHKR